ncbi:MAG: leucyl aminopeptidase, partial [Pseudomonadota bacterium]|nr:leucyl aminopeptidase [Pseudomonadota bacterium]
MDFSIKTFDAKSAIASVKSGCIVVGVFEDKQLSSEAKSLDGSGEISAAVKAGDITGKAGSSLMLRRVGGVNAERVLLVGLGKDTTLSQKDFTTTLRTVAHALANMGASDAVVALPLTTVADADV